MNEIQQLEGVYGQFCEGGIIRKQCGRTPVAKGGISLQRPHANGIFPVSM